VHTGVEPPRPGLGRLPGFPAGRASPDGWLPIAVPNGGVVLLGPDTTLLGLPEVLNPEYVWGASWTPDGRYLVVAQGNIVVVDPFAEGGARVVAEIAVRGAPGGQVFVVGSQAAES
jgi:hypothetical protein